MLERWIRATVRHRTVVVAAWLVIAGLGAWSTTRLPGLLANSFAVPGSDSDRAAQILARAFGERPDGSFVVAFRVHGSGGGQLRARLHRRLVRAARAVPTGHAGVLLPGAGVLYGDIETRLDLERAQGYTDAVRKALAGRGPPAAVVTGQPAIQHDVEPVLRSDLRRGEAIALPVALLVLLVVLGASSAVAVPFVVAGATIAGTMLLLYGVAHATSMVTWVTNLVVLIGLALAIDYSLLVVVRFREELRRHSGVEDAVVRTMATAGRTTVTSGLAVAAGLALLALVPLPFVRALGIAGLLIPLVAIAVTLTLQPALLSVLGRRALGRAPGEAAAGPAFWARLARTVVRRRVAVLVGGTAFMLAAAAPVAGLALTPGSLSGLPASLESIRGYRLLHDRVAAGAATPTSVVFATGRVGGARAREVARARARLADELFHDPEVYVVATGPGPPYVDPTGRYARVIAVGRHEYGDGPTQRFVDRLRSDLIPRARPPAGTRTVAGGAPAQGVDFLARAYAAFPWLAAGVLLTTYLILLRAFRSLVLPLKAVLLNVLTVAAVYGLLVVAFTWDRAADTLGLHGVDRIDGWIPIFLFAILFGISMDYEVFLVMRVRECWDRTGETMLAVELGLERTGRVITAAAAIMVASFAGFVAGHVAGLQQLGLGLALAVLLDATVVRCLVAPALMAVLGRWNWWLPVAVARVVRVPPSPLPPGEGPVRPSPGAIST